jgi:hypothetical protein
MAWTTRNSLNRWCLRSLIDNADSPLYKLQPDSAGIKAPHKGVPPLMNACIAPYCDAWAPLDDERGVCLFCKKLKERRKTE